MHKLKLHKRAMLTALLLAVLVFPAGAVSFSCEDFDLEIPEGGKTYYYSQQGTNMTGTMLENAQKQDMLLLIGSYNDGGSLLYTFRADEREGTAEDVAGQLQTELASSYSLDVPVEEQLNGRSGWALNGQSVSNSNYMVKIFVAGEFPSLMLTMMYQNMAEGELQKLLDSLEWSDLTMEMEPGAIPLPGVDAGDETDESSDGSDSFLDLLAPQPLEPIPDTEKAGIGAWLISAASSLRERAFFLLAGLGAAVLMLLLVLLRRFFRKPLRRGKKRSYAPRHARR